MSDRYFLYFTKSMAAKASKNCREQATLTTNHSLTLSLPAGNPFHKSISHHYRLIFIYFFSISLTLFLVVYIFVMDFLSANE